MVKAQVLTFGEMLFDELPTGRRPGGGPFNTAAHLVDLGVHSALLSAVGEDDLGDALLQTASSCGVQTDFIQRNSLPTGTVTVSFDESLEATYTINKPVAWDAIESIPTALLNQQVEDKPLVVAWILGLRSATSQQAFYELVEQHLPDAYLVLDAGLRLPHLSIANLQRALDLARLVKLNDEELSYYCTAFSMPDDAAVFAARFELDLLIVTHGAAGASAWQNGQCISVEAPRVSVVDTVGCGDAFLAGYLSGMLEKESMLNCLQRGVRQGAKAAQRAGGLP